MPDEARTEVTKGAPFKVSAPKWVGEEGGCDARLWSDPLGANFLPRKEEGYENPVCPFDMQPCVHGQRQECPEPLEEPAVIQLPAVKVKKEEKLSV